MIAREKTATEEKPPAGISMDLDNLWSYMKTHGDEGWEQFPSYFDRLGPAVLEALEPKDLKITFFVVGQDAVLRKNQAALRLLADGGHEFGNHSFSHEPWLHRYSPDQLRDEIVKTERAILDVTGHKPTGFRGPGFSWSPELFRILLKRGYRYDASTLPTYLGPLARMYYFWSARLTPQERRQRGALFGRFRDGRSPLKPYHWAPLPNGRLLELPVTTIPILKTPFHLSYLLYLVRYSERAMRVYLQLALVLCRLTRTPVSFLLHPLDLLGPEHAPELGFFPGMDLSGATKRRIFRSVIRQLSCHFRLVKLSTFAEHVSRQMSLKTRDL